MRFIVHTVVLLCVVFYQKNSFSQQLPIQYYNAEKGGVAEEVTSMDFDEKGTLWVGSFGDGVYVFNGNKVIEHYTVSDGLKSNFIVHIYCHNDSVFVAQDNYLSIIYRGEITHLPIPELESGEELATVFYDSRNRLWLTTDKGKVMRYLSDFKSFKLFDFSEKVPYVEYLFGITEDQQQNIWFSSYVGGLLQFNNDTFVDISKKYNHDFVCVYNLLTTDSCVYVVSINGFYKIKNNQITNLIDPDKEPFFAEKSKYLSDVIQVENKIFAYTLYGLCEIKIHSDYIEVLNLISISEGLKLYDIYGIHKDYQNNIWLQTMKNGLVKVPTQTIWQYQPQELMENFGYDAVSNVAKGVGNSILLESLGIFWQIDDKTGDVIKTVIPPDSMGSEINNVFPLDSNYTRLWSATEAEGMVYYDYSRNYFKGYCQCGTRNAMPVILGSIQLGADSFLVQNIGEVALFYDTTYHFFHFRENGKLDITTNRLDTSIYLNLIFNNVSYYNRQAYIATSEGVFIWEKGTTYRKWNVPQLMVSIDQVERDKNGFFWVLTTDAKLYRFNEGTKELKDFTDFVHPKIASKPFYIFIHNNELWCDLKQKIILDDNSEPVERKMYLSHKVNSLINFTEHVPVFTQNNIYLSSVRKTIRFSQAILNQKNVAPQLSIINAFNLIDSVYFGNFKQFSPTAHTINIKISINDYDINRDFIELQYCIVENGDSSQWIAASSKQSSFLFANLKPAKYDVLFRTKYIDSDKFSPIEKITFAVLPFWYQTIWFYLLVMTLLFIGLLLFYRYKKQQLLAKAQTERQIAMLQIKALQAQMNPHFIFNTLNTIQFHILENDNEVTLDLLSKFSKLIRLTFEIIGKKKITLTQEIAFLKQYIEIERQRFDQKFNYQINVDKSLDVNSIYIPPLLIQPFVENAILHAFNTTQKAMLTINFSKKDRFLIITIKDSGSGFPDTYDVVSNNAQPHAIGITKERLNIINKLNNKKLFTLNIISNQNGTTVELKIPLNYDKSSNS